MSEHFDVLIIGAGLSGIGAAVHLRRGCPGKTFAILEAREAIGGTWDLFRYPGIRSDSDMYTLGYAFKPWKAQKAIADGASILSYVRETAVENDLVQHVRFQHRVTAVSWSSEDARWTVEVERGPEKEPAKYTCNFIDFCAGYFEYETGHAPAFPGSERFKGRVVHPQHWGADVDYEGKRVVVIGSGATAVTLVPTLAQKAAHVTMLQRSPTYMVSLPSEDVVANGLRSALPPKVAYELTRWKNVLFGMTFFELSRRRPALVKKRVLELVRKELPGDVVEKHFTPTYGVWDQRVCLVPDQDFFKAVRSGRASVVTDTIETFTEKGIKLASGDELEADLIVTATGLKLKFLGGAKVTVDGSPVEPARLLNYKGAMFSGVPNLICTFGYTNASWTLKADLTSAFLVRLLKHMDATGTRKCVANVNDPSVTEEPFLPLASGYVKRAEGQFPKQGSKRPWKLFQNYFLDIAMLRMSPVADGVLDFS